MLDLITDTKLTDLEDSWTVAIAKQLVQIYRAQGRHDKIETLKRRVPAIRENEDGELSSQFDVIPLPIPPEGLRAKSTVSQTSNVKRDHADIFLDRQLRARRTF
jgi:hypothetical protein